MATALKYTILAGDTLSSIVDGLHAAAGVSVQEIEQANPGLNPNALAVGQVIAIPQAAGVNPPHPEPATDAKIIGIWWWTWSSSTTPPAGANLGIAFSGWTDPTAALQNSAHVKNKLPGSKFIALGGGNEKGAWTSASLNSATAAILANQFAGYDGIAYDVEEGDSGLEALFEQSFAAAKARGFKVLVTVSHSAPYGIADGGTLMQSFFSDPNIDILSPQLYTTGSETGNDYATSHGVTWAQYASARAAVAPSIVKAGMYADAQAHFLSQGVTLSGFIQWSQ